VAPNGVKFGQLFSLDLAFNLWVWQPAGVYLFADSSFWAQRPAPGQTNPAQGVFDFSKREFDFNVGTAWNYYGLLEARAFAYSMNNLNRGTSPISPKGYADGIGLENRLYLNSMYSYLGTPGFDVARAAFISAGYYPSKDMVDGDGNRFKPGPFLRAYLTCDLWEAKCYLYADGQFIASRACTAELLQLDAGIAFRPLVRMPRLEFRVGTEDSYYPAAGETETSCYGSIRFVF
jgi:hypothetical protein